MSRGTTWVSCRFDEPNHQRADVNHNSNIADPAQAWVEHLQVQLRQLHQREMQKDSREDKKTIDSCRMRRFIRLGVYMHSTQSTP